MALLRDSRVLALSCVLAWSFSPAPAGAVEIVSPRDGAIVSIGAEIVIQVRPSPGDDIDRAYLAQSDEHLKHNSQTGFFEQTIKLQGDSLGPIPIEVWSKNSKGVVSSARVVINVNLPPVLPLLSLRIHAEQRKMVLERIGEQRDLQVIGEFPDGTVRFISRSVFGTTYQSRNEAVARVDANGVVTATGIGEATIIVRNGDKEAQSTVTVRPKPGEGEKKET